MRATVFVKFYKSVIPRLLRNYRRKLFLPALAYVATMACATLYLRYHYLIDVIAAFAFAPAAYLANDFLLRHWPGERKLSPSIRENPLPAANATI